MQDQRLRALWLSNGQNSDSYSPGEQQRTFFAFIGDGNAAIPSHDEAIAELVACAAADYQQHRLDEITEANKRAATERERAQSAAQLREKLESAEARVADLEAELATARAELRDVTKQRDHLRVQRTRPPRRVKRTAQNSTGKQTPKTKAKAA